MQFVLKGYAVLIEEGVINEHSFLLFRTVAKQLRARLTGSRALSPT